MKAAEKIGSASELRELCAAARLRGRRVVFTNGCFDIMHVGHLRYLEAARELGDMLVVGVNTDGSVARIKGPGRPIVGERERAEMVAGLHCVDCVALFDEPDPLKLIETAEPDVLVKGADWAVDKIVGADFVLARGGKVLTIPLVPGVSTTTIIQRIADRAAADRAAADGSSR